MFTGIIEQTGVVELVSAAGSNITLTIRAAFSNELKTDQSVAHNGVCLTVESIEGETYTVTAIEETLQKTTLGSMEKGSFINLERCLRFDGRLDGHIVQGHVDTVGTCIARDEKNGSWEFSFSFDPKFATLIIEKGSVSLNGISLTLFDVTESSFRVAVIPYTFEHTNMQDLRLNDTVNIEFDMIGKYVQRMQQLTRTASGIPGNPGAR
ncbi:MAG: riboflavin synthase [Ferruginibacter sp.]